MNELNNGLGRLNLLLFKCFRFYDAGWGGTWGGGVTCLYSWRGGGGGGGGGGDSVDPFNIIESALFPFPSVLIVGPTKGVE